MSDNINELPELSEDDYALDSDYVDQILNFVEDEDQPGLLAHLDELHAADIADLLEQISATERREFIEVWGAEFDGEVLSELSESVREEVLFLLPGEILANG